MESALYSSYNDVAQSRVCMSNNPPFPLRATPPPPLSNPFYFLSMWMSGCGSQRRGEGGRGWESHIKFAGKRKTYAKGICVFFLSEMLVSHISIPFTDLFTEQQGRPCFWAPEIYFLRRWHARRVFSPTSSLFFHVHAPSDFPNVYGRNKRLMTTLH